MIQDYLVHVGERAALGVPPLPLTTEQTRAVCELLLDPPAGQGELLLDLISSRVPPGVDPAAEVKAGFLGQVARGELRSPAVGRRQAVALLGTMLGGYNTPPLLGLLEDPELGPDAAEALSRTLFVLDAFPGVWALVEKGVGPARRVVESWAAAEWFTRRPEVPREIRATVFKVDGEVNTDDFSPAKHAPTRPDIPLHAQTMGATRFPGGLAEIARLKAGGLPVAFVGDVVGTGSSRKSACNSLVWHIGEDIPHIPNKRRGGVVLGGVIAPIFFNTAEDSGALPIQCDVSRLTTGQVVVVRPHDGLVADPSGEALARFELRPPTLLDEVRAGGRVQLIIGQQLTARARAALGLGPLDLFVPQPEVRKPGVGFTLAQKIVGRACGADGVHPGTVCLPRMTSVASQDTTGPMTADEVTELACLRFVAPLVMQSFCHTAAYPTEVDRRMHQSLPPFMADRGGVALAPGDGVVHSWVNRMILPDTVGTGGDSHTRFPVGISFPAGSGLVAFAAALGVMPLEMPESVLVRLRGSLSPGITLRDVVNAIPWVAIRQGLLTTAKKGKKNVFNGRILEIEGLPGLHVEQAFELTDASAERSAAAATIALGRDTVAAFLRSNVALLSSLVRDGYRDPEALRQRIAAMEAWLAAPELLSADADAEYAAVLDVDLDALKEPILACPNDPDDVRLLSEVAGTAVDEVFLGSCMTNIGHFRAAARLLDGARVAVRRLWVTPPTRMDSEELRREGVLPALEAAGARVEIPGCSLCMGNQARVEDRAVVVSTSTRNFDHRMGQDARVFLASAELAAVTARLGRIPTVDEYLRLHSERIAGHEAEVYRYLSFDRMTGYAAG